MMFSCAGIKSNKPSESTTSFSDYWYNSEAEISSYVINQARYGENHRGTAVLVFVTEHFSTDKNTKTDLVTESDTPILKLNFTKKFNTGIYPYSLMTSTFYPIAGQHSLKVSSSSQEWCGHTYMELVNKDQYQISLNSYFEDESFEKIQIEKVDLEDDVWTQIRLNPEGLKTGKSMMIPSFFYLRLKHQETKAYQCNLAIEEMENYNSYSINYPDLNRTLAIQFEKSFPYKILSWQETYESGWGENKKELTTTAKLINSIKSDYWNENKVKDSYLRKQLDLDK